MLVSDAITRVRSLLAENQAGFFQDSEIITWLNEGNLVFHNKKGIETIWTTDIDDGTKEVSIMDTMIKLNQLYYQAEGSDSYIYIPPSEYQVFSNRIIFNNELESGSLKWLGETLPQEISTANDVLTIDKRFEGALIDYAVFKGMEKDQNPNASIYYAEFERLKARWENTNVDKNAGAKVRMYKRW